MVKAKRKSDPHSAEETAVPDQPANTLEQRHLILLNQHIEHSKALAKQGAEIERLYELAYFDKLTGLANQRLLEETFNAAVKKKEKIVLIFIDLNKFKQINDTYGHHVGDAALKLASQTLVSLTRPTDVIAHIDSEERQSNKNLPVRYAGDEFILLFTGVTLEDLRKKVIDVKTAFSTLTLKIEDDNIPVGASVGAYAYKTGDSLEHCKKQADEAMYADKKASRELSKISTTSKQFGWFAPGYTMRNFAAQDSYVPPITSYTFPKLAKD